MVYSRRADGEGLGVDHDSVGRIDTALLEGLLPKLEGNFYLCGPLAFMAAIQQGLIERGVPMERIHSESFGPAA